MTNINLLPWREELREERKRGFLVTIGAVVAFASVVVFLTDRYENNRIDSQLERNNFLSKSIAELDLKLVEIRRLREQKKLLTSRMSVIQELQGTRPLIVRLFDELVRTIPEGVYYNNISREGGLIKIEGNAESNARVSELMLDFESSQWFAEAKLDQISAIPSDGSKIEDDRIIFRLSVPISNAVKDEEAK